MATKKEVISAAAVDGGYDGPTPATISGAIEAYSTVAGGGGGGAVRLYCNEDDDNYYIYKDREWTDPATAEYIYGLAVEGKYVSVVFGTGVWHIFTLSFAAEREGGYTINFSAPYWDTGKGYVAILACYNISANRNGSYSWCVMGS